MSVPEQPRSTGPAWTRWRVPLAVIATTTLAVGQWDRVSSGEPFAVVTGLGVIGFWISAFFLTGPPAHDERKLADAWRRTSRRSALVYGFWAVVAWAWLGIAASMYSVGPLNFVVPAIPTVMTASQLATYRQADRIARLQQMADAR